MKISDLKIQVYADGANISEIREVAKYSFITGFTTNPSLLKRAGVTDYLEFAKQLVSEFPEKDISFEVFGTNDDEIFKEAEVLHDLGKNVFVKVPIMTTEGKPTGNIINKLSKMGINLNVTAVTTIDQVRYAENNLSKNTNNIISIFVGRVADAGNDPDEFIKESVEITQNHPEANLLWASTREVFNVIDAQKYGVDIITVPPALIQKLNVIGKTAEAISLDTVKGFERDIKSSGLTIL